MIFTLVSLSNIETTLGSNALAAFYPLVPDSVAEFLVVLCLYLLRSLRVSDCLILFNADL